MTRVEIVTQACAGLLEPLSDQERVEVFSALGDVYCEHCGGEQPTRPGIFGGPPRKCQCWNDE